MGPMIYPLNTTLSHHTSEHLTVLDDLIYYQQLCLTAAEDPLVESSG
ncbi:hypothetical protein PENSOL_c046G07177 [Penicillium solitum]|uniref:Uncharacterized protein n=1 Tax=Penicillium solitum TaxID=60172 RepID=A0A1V6QRX3_9EURO|nr:uncharacterized protein PENSOL_c046G07177 [Penicillium solitum]OQD91969.1 hypothetical protein PENSOL_c046G07177 [Penicillium solitum]